MHVILDTRPSRFSACNIENIGVAWGRGYIFEIQDFTSFFSINSLTVSTVAKERLQKSNKMVAGPPVFLACNIFKKWEWPGDEAIQG